MVRRLATLLFGAVLANCAAPSPDSDAGHSDVKPNIVIVITDDQGYGDLGITGNPIIQTPNIDAFALRSARFTDFHVDPTCSPTRAALLTGQHSMRAGVWHTIMGRSLLPTEKDTMAEHFRAAGYRTGLFGKWHLGDNAPYRPEDQGFETVVMHGGGGVGQTPDFWGNTQFDDTYLVNGTPKAFSGNATDVWFDAAIDFLREEDPRPSLSLIALNAPHRPWRAPEDFVAPYRERGLPEPMAQFYAMISHLDARFGDLLSVVDSEAERETIVIFMSDNGSAFTFAEAFTDGRQLDLATSLDPSWVPNAGRRGYKASVYEGGHRVPFFMTFPGLEDGREIESTTAHFDVLPTLVDLAGINADLDVDGRSVLPLLRDPEASLAPRPFVVTNQRVFQPSFDRPMAVIDGHWRLVRHGEANRTELFDLSVDPSQSNDIAAEHPARTARMMAVLEDWWMDFDREMKPNLIPVGSEYGSVRLTAMDWMEAPSTDAVPWFPGHAYDADEPAYPNWIGREDAFSPLPWYVDVREGGVYAMRVSVHDSPGAIPLGRSHAIIDVDGRTQSLAIDPDAIEAVVEVPLEQGFRKIRAFFADDDTSMTGRPAFYVTVTRDPS